MVIAKKHRLPAERYYGKINLAITARLNRPRDGFVDAPVVSECVSMLTAHASDTLCRVPIYCFMPNHVHMIIQGMGDESRTRECMDGFKETTALWFVRNRPRIHWQISYFDHIIRGCEDWREQARYIYLNPVRARLVVDPSEYPFTGSIGCELKDVLEDLSWMFLV